MKDVLVICSSNRLHERQTTTSIQSLVMAGAGYIDQTDTSDVSLARNVALTLATTMLLRSEYQIVLMVDDDMVFDTEQAARVIDYVRATHRVASAAYVLNDGRMAATYWKDDVWFTGLGFLAIPREKLIALSEESPKFLLFQNRQDRVTEFTKSGGDGEFNGEPCWFPEDTRLTKRLGGAVLLPVAMGHVKKRILWPDKNMLEGFIAASISGSFKQ